MVGKGFPENLIHFSGGAAAKAKEIGQGVSAEQGNGV